MNTITLTKEELAAVICSCNLSIFEIVTKQFDKEYPDNDAKATMMVELYVKVANKLIRETIGEDKDGQLLRAIKEGIDDCNAVNKSHLN
jgi:hypothetical protein